jgi:hypothetical protein
MLLDVAARRIAVDPVALAAKLQATWARFRGRSVAQQADQYLERLRSRKAAVGEQLERGRRGARFEPPPLPVRPAARPVTETAPHSPPEPARAAAPPTPAAPNLEPDDFAARLLKAKQKAREQIEGEKKEDESV